MKSFSFRILSLVIASLFCVRSAPAAESLSVLLQKGIYAEETEGNLDSAIKIYEQIAAEMAVNRPLAAQALYRLAVCYEKQGKKEHAVKALEEMQLLAPDAGVREKVREALARLGVSPANNRAIRKLSFPVAGDWFASISPDGRFVAYQPKGTSDLAVCELATGRSSTVFKGTKEDWCDYALISPDNRWIAYDTSQGAVVVSGIGSSETRTLYTRTSKENWVSVESWSRDGARLFISSGVDDGPSIVLALDPKTGAQTEMGTVPRAEWQNWYSVSSDGRFVARRVGGFPRRITLLDLKSGHEEVVLERDAGDFVGWTASDTKLVFPKATTRGNELWTVGVKDGKLAGDPTLLSSDAGVGSIKGFGATTDGNIYYSVRSGRDRSYWVMEGFMTPQQPDVEPSNIQTDIPADELIVGPNQVVHDRKLGLSFTLPTGWNIQGAVRRANGGNNFNLAAPSAKKVRISFSYRSTTPWAEGPTSSGANAQLWGPKKPEPDEVDAWLRREAELLFKWASERHSDAKLDPAGLVPRIIGGHKALGASIAYKNRDLPWTNCGVVIFSDKAHALITLEGPEAETDAIRPAFETLVSSFQLP